MAASAEPAKEHAQPALAAIDLDQDEWYVAVGDTAGRGETRVLSDASQLTACVGSAAVVASEECRNDLARVAPQIQPRFVPRLVSVARAFRGEIGDAPCLVLWMGRKQSVCGLVNGGNVVEEKTDPQFTLFGIFQYFAASLPGLQAWMKNRDEQQRTAAFEHFVSNLRNGTTLPVGSGRWMPSPARIPSTLVKDGFGRLRHSVDPNQQAAKLVVSGWASAAHWDLPQTLRAEAKDLSLIARPNGSGFYESVAGLMDYGWANPLPGQNRPNTCWIPGKSVQAADHPVTASEQPVQEVSLQKAPEPAQPPVPVAELPVTVPEPPPPPPPPPTPDLTPEAGELQGKRIVCLARAAAALVGRVGPRGATHRQVLKPYLALSQQSERLSATMERGAVDAQRKELDSFREAVSALDKSYTPADFFGVLDEFTNEPEAVEIRKHTRLEPIDIQKGSEIVPSKFEVIGQKGQGRLARVVDIYHRGYTIDGEVVRQPRVSVERYDVKRARNLTPVWWVGGAIVAVLVIGYMTWPGGFKRVATIQAGEPVLSVWSLPGTQRLVAQTGSGQTAACTSGRRRNGTLPWYCPRRAAPRQSLPTEVWRPGVPPTAACPPLTRLLTMFP